MLGGTRESLEGVTYRIYSSRQFVLRYINYRSASQ
jgi:hypothetical protein